MTTIWGNDQFTLSPYISSVDPSNVYHGDSTIITGTAFQPTQGSSTITICGISATIISWSNTEIIIQVPYTVACGLCGQLIITVAGESYAY